MPQKEEIIELLKKNKIMTQADFPVEMYGDNKHLPNVYASLMNLVKSGIVIRKGNHPAYYSLASNDVEMSINESYKNENVVSHRKPKVNIPKPTSYEVDYWLKAWNSLPDSRTI